MIRKYYGEKMMHLCRELFPTLLEEKGLLYNLISSNFAHSKFLYEDIVEQSMIEHFKDYIYSFTDNEETLVVTEKNPFELMSDAGYMLYECKTEEQIQSFKKYYAFGEELCTFKDTRLDSNYVFFAVKKDVNEIKRAKNPQRQDEYGTSVISIQFTRGEVNTLSIKNRYNHRVGDPDATFSNNLENIIPGLTYSFMKYYNFNINQNKSTKFELKNYTKANDGRYYQYNCETYGTRFCVNNLIIDDYGNINSIYQNEPERYIVFDHFLLDMKEKSIISLEKAHEKGESFVEGLANIEKINIIKNKENGNKTIELKIKDNDSLVYIVLDKHNRIIEYINNNLINVDDDFLMDSKFITKVEMNNLETIGEQFMRYNNSIEYLSLPNAISVGRYFMRDNYSLKKLNVPNILNVGSYSLVDNLRMRMYIHLVAYKNMLNYKMNKNKNRR